MSKSNSTSNFELLPRCLVMIFSKEDDEESKVGDSSDLLSNGGEKNDENIGLFEDFIDDNKGCFWDPHLEESLSNVSIAGIIFPNTVLVTGRDIHLDTIRRAWSKRVLRSPVHYTLLTVGEIPGLDITPIKQAQFTSLPDALCMIVADLNKSGLVATFDAILEGLKLTHEGVHQPAEEVIYEALGNLIKERKLYHTGKGYHIITPDLYAHLNHLNGCVTLHGKQSAILMPYQSLPTSEMCSIACQTECKEEEHPEELKDTHVPKGRFMRSSSFKEQKKSKEKKLSEKLTRSQSLRLSDGKAKSLLEDLEFKATQNTRYKEKGHKRSVLRRIFGSKKKKQDGKGKQPIYSNISEIEEQVEEPEKEKPKVELVTFSGQFPPPDMQLYSDKLLMMQPPQIYHLSKMKGSSSPYSHPPGAIKPHMVDADTQSEVDELIVCPIPKSSTMPADIASISEMSGDKKSKTLPTNSMRDFMDQRRTRIQKNRKSSSHSPESNRSLQLNSPDSYDSRVNYQERILESAHKGVTSSATSPLLEQNHHTHLLPRPDSASKRPYSQFVGDVRPRKSRVRTQSASLRSSTVNSSMNSGEDIYESIHERSVDHSRTAYQSYPNELDSTVEDNRFSLYKNSSENSMFRHHFSPPFNRKSTVHTSTPNNVKNSSHKNRVYRKYREICNTPTPEEVSSDRRIRRRHSQVKHAQSCDSGVNCVGLHGANGKMTPNGNFNHIEINPRSSLDLRQDSRERDFELRHLHRPEPVRKAKGFQRGYSLDERQTPESSYDKSRLVTQTGTNAIEDSGFTSNKSANETNLSHSANVNHGRKQSRPKSAVLKEYKSNHNMHISRGNSDKNYLNQNGKPSMKQMNGHVPKTLIQSRLGNQNNSNDSVSRHAKENSLRKKMFLETDLDDTLDSVPEEQRAVFSQHRNYSVNFRNRPTSNYY